MSKSSQLQAPPEGVSTVAADGAAAPGERPAGFDEIHRLWLMVNESDNAIIVAGADTRIIHVNHGFTRMFGYERAEMLGRKISETLVGPHTDMQTVQSVLQRLKLAGTHADILFYSKAGRPVWVSVVANPMFDAKGEFTNVVGVFTDITQTKMHEVLQHKVLDAMAHERPMLDIMALVCREVERIAPEVVASIVAVDADGHVQTLAAPNLPPQFCEALDGMPIGPQAGSCGTSAWRKEPVLVTDIASDPLWAPYPALKAMLGFAACWSSPIQASDGRVLGTFAFYFRDKRGPDDLHRRLVDVSLHLCALALEREEARAHIHQLAFFDTLTGLPNRAMLRGRAERTLVDMHRGGAPLAVLFIDLDRFKLVNDTQGHAAGDELLREMAQRLVAEVRGDDLIGRLAGDEFVAVLPHCGAEQAALTAERLLAVMAEPMALGGISVNSGASVGIAMFPEDGQNIDTLLRHADMAMYQAKNDGRGRMRFFSDEMNRIAQERVALESALRDALRDGSLRLHYQPQMECRASHRLLGVEALARWTHPRFGEVAPLRFIALAEECGLIGKLGRWVLGEACRQLADWRSRGVPVPRVAVNVSPHDFRDPELPAIIAATLRAHGLTPADLTLEMTESVMLDTNSPALAVLEEVHALGVRLSLDDFGTGYSSLSYLHRLPIDELKLDKSFVRDLALNPVAQALINTVVRIGDSLSLTVVAEGVETTQQHAFLAERACPVVQGFLFSRPLPADELEKWMQTSRPLGTAVPSIAG
ncbi:MAG TPA: EAL domain-containing protein [Burkholderiaceae bacterium]|nr:EAL domain-containing protein [Burkholderiaceae bacterium]